MKTEPVTVKVSDVESQALREESSRRGVEFSDEQWSHFIHKILEPRLSRQRRLAERAVNNVQPEQTSEGASGQGTSESQLSQVVEIEERIKADPNDQYDAWAQQHLDQNNKLTG